MTRRRLLAEGRGRCQEERNRSSLKGFAQPIRCHTVLGLYDDLAGEDMIREESDDLKFSSTCRSARRPLVARLKA
jgi:hypothetical protein